jgi:Phage portal protein, SPP1 Gp6-like
MGAEEADQLEEIIQRSERWPIWSADYAGGMDTGAAPQEGMYGTSAKDIELWIAIRESDRDRIAKLIEWDNDSKGRKYKVDPLGERISQAFSDLLFGEDPEWKAGDEADEEQLTALVKENDFASELRSAVVDASSEGEIWWRCYVDPDESEFPMVEFVSRLDVIPLFHGRKLAAAAFISVLFTQEILLDKQRVVQFWRHITIDTDGETRNLLFKGQMGELGVRVPLDTQPETADLPDEWKSGLPFMLSGRVLNKRGRDKRLGISDYQGIKDQLLDLNEAAVIMAENARMSGKSRMIVPANAVDSEGKVDLGADVIVDEGVESFDAGSGARGGPYAVLEYTFQAEQLIAYQNHLIAVAQTRVGLASQFMGGSRSGSEGSATSGTALRTRFIPTVLAASGKGRYWDAAMPKILLALQQLDAMDAGSGGCGHHWVSPNEPPMIERSSVLPEDPSEAVDLRVTSVAGEVESVEAAIRKLNPEFSDEQVEEELGKIQADRGEFGIGEHPGGAMAAESAAKA